jgi:hypothetical protein
VRPLAIDLYCGLGGWTEGLLAEGYDVVGFDIENHVYGEHRYLGRLVLQDVRTLHGSQFKNASLIVASPPCQKYSYMAMPWSKAKKLAEWYYDAAHHERLVALNELFDACFRIQREAIEAAGRFIPLVVENVVGAQKWVGRARWHYGSYYLWGDVPALMPIVRPKRDTAFKNPGFRFNGNGKSFQSESVGRTQKGIPHSPTGHWTNPSENGGIKQGRDWFNSDQPSISRLYGSKSPKRKMASAMIAKIPFELAAYIGRTYYPQTALAKECAL